VLESPVKVSVPVPILVRLTVFGVASLKRRKSPENVVDALL
jgi:hypothetical protein